MLSIMASNGTEENRWSTNPGALCSSIVGDHFQHRKRDLPDVCTISLGADRQDRDFSGHGADRADLFFREGQAIVDGSSRLVRQSPGALQNASAVEDHLYLL